MIGTFGSIVFEVSGEKTFTFDGLSRKAKAVFARHERGGAKPVLEFTGPDLSEISFRMHLSISLGVEPKTEADALYALMNAGDEKQLIIGGSLIGTYVITDIADTWSAVSAGGRIMESDLSVTLLEFSA
jgi:phage protein U